MKATHANKKKSIANQLNLIYTNVCNMIEKKTHTQKHIQNIHTEV